MSEEKKTTADNKVTKSVSKPEKKEIQQEKRKTNWSLFFWGFLCGIGLFFLLRLLDKLRRIV